MTSETTRHAEAHDDQLVLRLSESVLKEVVRTVGVLPAESGGACGGGEHGQDITVFHFDESSRNSAVTYSPDYKFLNKLFKEQWNPAGIRLRGFFHSHPGRMGRPSLGDEVYAERILKAIPDLDVLWLPIINTVPDTGQFRFTPWAATRSKRGVSIRRALVQVIPDEAIIGMEEPNMADSDCPRPTEVIDTLVVDDVNSVVPGVWPPAKAVEDEEPTRSEKAPSVATIRPDRGQTFARVEEAYDLERMRSTRIVAVGAGGAASWLEEHARAGGEQFVLIDPDIVSETNLATQQVYRRDIGRPKVDCIGERIRDINPLARVVSIQKILDDLTDEELHRWVFDSIDGRDAVQTLLCGLTDAFVPQARVNRLALQFGIPSLCAQVYREGRGLELTFTHPEVTPACNRCILSSRYRYYIEQGQTNAVTSAGTPIFATTRLNAIKGFIALAIIHHGSEHPRWGHLLERIGNRNLVQVRVDPDFGQTMGMKVFDRVFGGADQTRILFDETVWLPQAQECPETGYPPCPDCGGTGRLLDAKGRFIDTRLEPTLSGSNSGSPTASGHQVKAAISAYRKGQVHS